MATSISVPVSVGELLDKITILRIKREKITAPSKLINIELELAQLENVCRQNDIDLQHRNVSDLYAINLALWQIEDDIRIKEAQKEFDSRFIELARAVYVTNDRRFEVKSRINEASGSTLREEKSYESY